MRGLEQRGRDACGIWMGGSSIICPGADPDSVYIVEFRSFVTWFKATLDGRDRLSSPAPYSFGPVHIMFLRR